MLPTHLVAVLIECPCNSLGDLNDLLAEFATRISAIEAAAAAVETAAVENDDTQL